MIILGIDPGYDRCGFAFLEVKKGKMKLLEFGIIKTSPKDNFYDRLLEISADIKFLFKKYKPDVMGIESLFFGNNVSTAFRVAEVRGVLLYLGLENNCKIFEPKPVEVKSCFTGNGKASKQDMQKMVPLLFSIKESPKLDDAADAIAVAYFSAISY